MNERRPRVLVVEDQEPVRAMLLRVFSKNGLDVELVASGEQALARLGRRPGFEVVVTDLLMPGVHGIPLLKEMARVAPGVPLIVLTGSEITRIAVETAGCKVFDFLQKPLETSRLTSSVFAAAREFQPR